MSDHTGHMIEEPRNYSAKHRKTLCGRRCKQGVYSTIIDAEVTCKDCIIKFQAKRIAGLEAERNAILQRIWVYNQAYRDGLLGSSRSYERELFKDDPDGYTKVEIRLPLPPPEDKPDE